MKKYIIIAALILSIVALILSIIALGISNSNYKVFKGEDRIIYENEVFGLSIVFPSEWKGKYVINESEGSIAVYSKKVNEKYPGVGLLFTIERIIGELITQEDMDQEPVPQQIILQGNGYTYFTRQPSDVQYPLNDREVSNEYIDLREQISNVSQWTSLLGDNTPKAKNQGFKVAGSSFFTVEIPNEWDLKALEEPTLRWSLFDSNNNVAGVIELIPYKSELIGEKTIGKNMVREYLYDTERFREIEIVFNSELVDQEAMEIIKNSLVFVGGPFNVIDLQSNAMQYLSRGGKKVFGTIEDFDFSKDRTVAVRINVMQLLSSDSSEEYSGYTFEDLDKIETYTLDFEVNVAPLVAPGYNTYGIYDIEKINEEFIKNQENYKLKEWMDTRQNNSASLFNGKQSNSLSSRAVEYIVEKYAYYAKLVYLSHHILRHTFLKSLVDAGESLDRVAILAGHENLNTTAKYTRPTATDLQKSVDKLIWE